MVTAFIDLILSSPGWIKYPALFVTLALTVLTVLTLGLAAKIVAVEAFDAGHMVVMRGSALIANLIIFAVSESVGAITGLIKLVLRLLFLPLRLAAVVVRDTAERAACSVQGYFERKLADRAQAREEAANPRGREQEEQPFWNFYKDFGNREDFARAAAHWKFIEAARLFGLPEDGGFTQRELDRAYRSYMSKHHPDRGGTNADAIRGNEARATIKREKGWT